MDNSPELDMINLEIDRLTKKSIKKSLSIDDLKKLESLIKMRVILKEKPQTVYVQDYSDIYDRTILATINQKDLPPSKRKGYKKPAPKTKTKVSKTKVKVKKE